MKIINKTVWNTKELLKIFDMVLKKKGVMKSRIRILEIITSTRQGHIKNRIGGTAYILGHRVRITIPRYTNKVANWVKGKDGHTQTVKEELPILTNEYCIAIAQVFEHEVDHILGLKHKEMGNWWEIDVSYIPDDFVIHLKEEKLKPKIDLVQKRFDHARKMLKVHESKFKREGNRVKFWKKKVRYYVKKKGVK